MDSEYPRLTQLLASLEVASPQHVSLHPPQSLVHARNLATTYALLAEERPIHDCNWTPTVTLQLKEYAHITPIHISHNDTPIALPRLTGDRASINDLESRLRKKLHDVILHVWPTAHVKTETQLLAEAKRLVMQIEQWQTSIQSNNDTTTQYAKETSQLLRQLLLISFEQFNLLSEVVLEQKGRIDFSKKKALVEANKLMLENIELKLRLMEHQAVELQFDDNTKAIAATLTELCTRELQDQECMTAQVERELSHYASVGDEFDRIAQQYASTTDEITRVAKEIERVNKSYNGSYPKLK